MTKVDEQQMKEDLVSNYFKLEEMGLMHQASGNISCRINGGMLISCSGATAENLTLGRVVTVLDDSTGEGDAKPSSEWRMHLAVYHRHEDANAVVHTHSDYCVAMACNNLPLPGFHYSVGTFGGSDVPCVPYSTFGTESLASDAAEALSSRAACLLGNHGMICRGNNLDIAVAHAQRMEILCKHYVLARQLGEPDRLSEKQWDEYFEQAKKVAYGSIS